MASSSASFNDREALTNSSLLLVLFMVLPGLVLRRNFLIDRKVREVQRHIAGVYQTKRGGICGRSDVLTISCPTVPRNAVMVIFIPFFEVL